MGDDDTIYGVTYLEISPQYASTALAQLLEDKAQFDVLQRIAHPHHLVVLDHSENTTPLAANRAHLIAPPDRREHTAFSVGPAHPIDTALYVVTHVDIIPPRKDEGLEIITGMSEASRAEDGNLRFDALVQSDRGNHLSLLEIWRDKDAHEAHLTAAYTINFRNRLTELCGSPYDERHYRLAG